MTAATLKSEYPEIKFYGFQICYYDGTFSKVYSTVARAYKQACKDALHGKDNRLVGFGWKDGRITEVELAAC